MRDLRSEESLDLTAGPAPAGCREYRQWSRRQFLGGGLGATVGALTAPAWLPAIGRAAPGAAPRDTLVYLFLRGGMDGLSVCVPYGDGDYYDARPNLALPGPGSADGVLDLDGFFGLNRAAEPLRKPFLDGRLALVHAAGSHDPTRSHFEAFTKVEFGVPGQSAIGVDAGWLGRALHAAPPIDPAAPLRAAAIAKLVPKTLAKGPKVLAIPDPPAFVLPGSSATAQARRAAIEATYAGAAADLAATVELTFAGIDLLGGLGLATYQPEAGVAYPDTLLGSQLRSAAALIKADVGLEAITIDHGTWDHHAKQGPSDGVLAELLDDLARSLAAFDADITAVADRVTLVAHSEFGRRVAENGSLGTDHGHGGLIFALGGNVRGGQVHGDWPGLAPDQLDSGDLAVTTDYRDVLGEVLLERMGVVSLAEAFPGHAYVPQGLID